MIKTQKEIEEIVFKKKTLSFLSEIEVLDIMRHNLQLLRKPHIQEFLPKGAICYCPYMRKLYIVHQPLFYESASYFYGKSWDHNGKVHIVQKKTLDHNILINKEYAERYS